MSAARHSWTRCLTASLVVLAMCAASRSSWGYSTLDSKAYVQDGLIAQWDGIDNVLSDGVRSHDSSSTVWSDLTGNGHDFALSSYIGSQVTGFSDNSLKAKSCYCVPCANPNGVTNCKNYKTIEICAKHGGSGVTQVLFNSGDGLKKFCAVMKGTVQFYNAGNQNYAIGSGSAFQAACVHDSASDATFTVYTNGVVATQTANDTWSVNSYGTCLGLGANTYQYTGEYYAIRLYDRPLTAAELAANAAVDRRRFLGSDGGMANMLVISSEPTNVGTMFPACDDYWFSVGEQVTCTASASWASDDGKMKATCTGYKVYTNGVVMVSGTGNEFTYTHPDCPTGAKLVWQWAVECKVTATAGAGGTVDKSEQWIKAGEPATIVATPNDGFCFYRWTGDTSLLTDATRATISLSAVNQPIALVAEFAGIVHVETNGSDETGDGSADKPYGTIEYARTKVAEGGMLFIGEGEHTLTNTVELNNPIKVVGVDVTNSVVTGASLYNRAFVISDAGVVVSNLTFKGINGSKTQGTHGVAVTISKGLVTDCRFISNKVQPNYTGGGGAYITGGTVRNCYFSGNGGSGYGIYGNAVMMTAGTLTGCSLVSNTGGSTASSGGGVHMSGGTVTNCLIKSCSSYEAGGIRISGGTVTHSVLQGNWGKYGGIYADGWPTIKDCLIIKNSGGTAGGVCFGGNSPTLRHCTIYGNTSSGATAGYTGLRMSCGTAKDNIIYGNTNGKDGWLLGSCYVTGGTFNSNVVDVAVNRGSGNQAADPLFKDAANGDFTVKLGSPAIAAGYPGGGYDLARVTRPATTATTCGAYEFVSAGGDLQVAILIKQGEYAEGDTVTAEVMTDGGDGSVLSYKWYLNGSSEVYSTESKLVVEACASGKYTLRVEVTQGGGDPVSDTKTDAVVVYPRHVYVDGDNATPQWPYATPGTAATDIHTAFAALWKDSVLTGIVDLAEGTYPLSQGIAILNPIVIRGQGREKTTVDASALSGVTSAFTLSNAGGTISNLTLKVGSRNGNGTAGAGVNMSKGSLTDCRVTDSNMTSYNSYGGPLCMTGGRVERCQFDKCRGATATGGKATGVYAGGGTITDCDIFDSSSGLNGGGGLYVAGATVLRTRIHGCYGSTAGTGVYLKSGSLVNCLVYANTNTSSACAAGVYASGGTVKYCTVYGNVEYQDGDGRSGIQVDGAATIVNNIFWGNGPDGSTRGSVALTGSGYVFKGNLTDVDQAIDTNKAGDPKFRDADAWNLHLKGASAARGLAVVDYAVAADYDGVERDAATHCSGAYEYVKGEDPFGVDILMSTATHVKKGTSITFTAMVENAEDESAVTYAWKLDDAAFGTTRIVTTDQIVTGVHTVKVSATEGDTTVEATPIEFWVQPAKVYAGPERAGVTPRYPYDAPEIAATNVTDAVKALWLSNDSTGVVEIAEGTVMASAGMTLGNPVVVHGAGSGRTIITGYKSSSARLFALTHADAEVRDLCVSNLTLSGGSALVGAFSMSAGTVRRVRIHKIVTSSHYNSGVGMRMTGGTFEDCEIVSCTAAGSNSGGGLYMSKGTVNRCLIKDCTGDWNGCGGALVLGGTMKNTLIVGCNGGWNGGVVSAMDIQNGAKVINCTVVKSPATGSLPIVRVGYNGGYLLNSIVWNERTVADVSKIGGTVANCCYKDATGSGNIAEDPNFRNTARGDYRIRIGSPCIDAGDWTQLGDSKESVKDATDLRDVSRLFGENVDMGCYENPKTGLTFIVR